MFEQLAAYFGGNETPVIVGDRAVFANPVRLADFFAVFGERVRGTPADTARCPGGTGSATAAVVAYHWAATHFGSDRAAIGKTITVYGDTVEIVGVAAPGFRYPGSTDIWSPMRPTNHA